MVLLLRIESFRPARAIGIGLGFLGVLFIIGPEDGLPDRAMVPWVLLALVTPLLYAANSILSAKLRPEGTHSLAAAFGMMLTSSIMTLPVMLATGTFYPLLANGLTVTDAAMLGQIAVAAFAYMFYFEIIRRAGPVYISQVSYVVIAFGLFWGVKDPAWWQGEAAGDQNSADVDGDHRVSMRHGATGPRRHQSTEQPKKGDGDQHMNPAETTWIDLLDAEGRCRGHRHQGDVGSAYQPVWTQALMADRDQPNAQKY